MRQNTRKYNLTDMNKFQFHKFAKNGFRAGDFRIINTDKLTQFLHCKMKRVKEMIRVGCEIAKRRKKK